MGTLLFLLDEEMSAFARRVESDMHGEDVEFECLGSVVTFFCVKCMPHKVRKSLGKTHSMATDFHSSPLYTSSVDNFLKSV